MGAGKAITSAPYWRAAELFDNGSGVLIPFEDPKAIATAAIDQLDNDATRNASRRRAYLLAPDGMNRATQSYMHSFWRASAHRTQSVPLGLTASLSSTSLQTSL